MTLMFLSKSALMRQAYRELKAAGHLHPVVAVSHRFGVSYHHAYQTVVRRAKATDREAYDLSSSGSPDGHGYTEASIQALSDAALLKVFKDARGKAHDRTLASTELDVRGIDPYAPAELAKKPKARV